MGKTGLDGTNGKAIKNGQSLEAPSVKVAPAPLEIIPRSIATSGLMAYILVAKFVDHMPFYRQEQQFSRLGVEISRANMTNWAIQPTVRSFCEHYGGIGLSGKARSS